MCDMLSPSTYFIASHLVSSHQRVNGTNTNDKIILSRFFQHENTPRTHHRNSRKKPKKREIELKSDKEACLTRSSLEGVHVHHDIMQRQIVQIDLTFDHNEYVHQLEYVLERDSNINVRYMYIIIPYIPC